MANWMTGAMMGYMIGIELLVGIYDAGNADAGKAGQSITYIPSEVTSSGASENQTTNTGITIIIVNESGGPIFDGHLYPI